MSIASARPGTDLCAMTVIDMRASMHVVYRLAARYRRMVAAAGAARRARAEACWRADPLSHPALRGMSPHQLDDLPLDRTLFGREGDDGICLP